MSIGVVGVQLDSMAKLAIRRGPIPVVIEIDKCQRRMRFCKPGVQFQSPHDCLLCRRKSVFRGKIRVPRPWYPRVGQTDVGQGITGILVDCLSETPDSFSESLFWFFVPYKVRL